MIAFIKRNKVTSEKYALDYQYYELCISCWSRDNQLKRCSKKEAYKEKKKIMCHVFMEVSYKQV